jgi:murein DD-endopeptidase MepM/ murein hydrolase activator NlpD
MSKLPIVFILSLLSCSHGEAKASAERPIQQLASTGALDTSIDFNALNSAIRDGRIAKPEALRQMQTVLPQLKRRFYEHGGQKAQVLPWVFPVQGYGTTAIGGTKGDGYVARGYDYFDGNKHGGHPAHDIFITDKNQDGIDDKTKKPVNVLSMTGGIVIATEESWDTVSTLRGGKYVWIYDPNSNSLLYYAHNSRVFVHSFDIVMPGDTIATVGRTGLSAFKKRSPTHLHIMQLLLDDHFYPRPVNCYNDLVASSQKRQ